MADPINRDTLEDTTAADPAAIDPSTMASASKAFVPVNRNTLADTSLGDPNAVDPQTGQALNVIQPQQSSHWHPKFVDFLTREYHRLEAAYKGDDSFKQATHNAVDAAHPSPQAVLAAQANANAQQMAQKNPPPQHPWDSYTPEQKANLEQAYNMAEGIMQYRRAGGLGIAREWAPHAEQLAMQGGLSPDQATLLARYRMAKNGASDVPTGARVPALTEAQINARRDAFLSAPPEVRAQMLDEDRLAAQRELAEGHFDSLVGPPTAQGQGQ